jgi:hypothetical protein
MDDLQLCLMVDDSLVFSWAQAMNIPEFLSIQFQ